MIDLLVGAYGMSEDWELCAYPFIISLRWKCNLDSVNVYFVERAHRPVSSMLRNMLDLAGFRLVTTDLPPANSCSEDTGRFCNWMVDNCGSSPWFAIAHYDVEFNQDFLSYAKSLLPQADMVGNHHDGIVFVRREAYIQCRVGFTPLDCLRYIRHSYGGRIVSGERGRYTQAMDVGELLALRMNFLGLRHILLHSPIGGTGKSDMFTHHRQGSGHSAGRPI